MSDDLLIGFIKGFWALEAIDRLKVLGAYSEEPLEKQQELLIEAVIGHVQKAVFHISEFRGISPSEAAKILVNLVPGIIEHSDNSTFDDLAKVPR